MKSKRNNKKISQIANKKIETINNIDNFDSSWVGERSEHYLNNTHVVQIMSPILLSARNKKAQLGEGIVSFPTLILVLFIILVFLLISGGLSARFSIFGNSFEKQEPASVPIASAQGVLLKSVEVQLKDGAKKEMFVLQAVEKYWEGEIEIIQFNEAFKKLLEGKENNCLIIAQGTEKNPAASTGTAAIDNIAYKYANGKAAPIKSRYDRIQLEEISFQNKEGKTIYVQYFYGECPDEIK